MADGLICENAAHQRISKSKRPLGGSQFFSAQMHVLEVSLFPFIGVTLWKELLQISGANYEAENVSVVLANAACYTWIINGRQYWRLQEWNLI
jgi:hypothetical protein